MDNTKHQHLLAVLAFVVTLVRRSRNWLELVFMRTPIGMFLFLLLIWRWRLALVITVAIVAHELSHAVAFRWLGLGFKRIRYYFVFAETTPAKPMRNYVQLGYASLAGPAGGLIQAALLLAVYLAWPSRGLALIVTAFAFINLLNCLPILVLDGGGVWSALVSRLSSRLQWTLMALPVLAGVALTVWRHLWGLLFGLILAVQLTVIMEIRARHRTANEAEEPDWPALEVGQVLSLAVCYALTLAGLLAVYLAATHTPGFSWTSL